MIRREVLAADGTPAAWILIAQMEHARLARDLAEAWAGETFAPLVPRRELLWAIEHHDDGWLEWDRRAGVHPDTGIPRSFMEMDHAEALRIWTRSIGIAAEAGPLEGYLVAGHFCALGRRATAAAGDAVWPHADEFFARYEPRMAEWLAAWQAADPAANTQAIADQALRMLQFFDTFSLWCCCDESSVRETVETPGGPNLTIVPRTPYNMLLAPWPFRGERLALEVSGLPVPVVRYANRDELAAADTGPITLRWQLQAAQ